MKKKIIIFGVLILVVAAGYIIFTLKSGVELNEESPLGTTPVIRDQLEVMDEETKTEFMRQVDVMQSEVMEKSEAMPQATRLIASGDFKPRFHSVKGQALLIQAENQKILRFEDFETDNGPNLHIYLAADLGNDDFIDLGKIRATKGNVNYEIAGKVDTARYNKVLVWCVPFGVLFSYAELTTQ